MQHDHVDLRLTERKLAEAERDATHIAAALRGRALARVVHENAAHHFRRDAEKLRAIRPRHLTLIHETEERFVDERRRL